MIPPASASFLLMLRRARIAKGVHSRIATGPGASSIGSRASFSSGGGSTGAGFFQRISSFLVGAGIMALATQYTLYKELREGNKEMIKRQKALEARLETLEK